MTLGAVSATVRVSATPGGSTDVAFSATAVKAATIELDFPTAPFGRVEKGTTSGRTLTVKNVGGVDSSVPAITITGVDAADFSFTTTCTAALAPQATCTIDVKWTPSHAMGSTATVEVRALPYGGSISSSLSGYGTLANGETSGNYLLCTSGFSADNVCCNEACAGTCRSCAGGTCHDVTNAPDADTCPAADGKTCNGAAACKLLDGKPCTSASECLSGSSIVVYQDYDYDGYGDANTPSARVCGATPPDAYAGNNLDCCDSDNRVYPNAGGGTTITGLGAGWRTQANGCGAYDWNCSGTVEKRAYSPGFGADELLPFCTADCSNAKSNPANYCAIDAPCGTGLQMYDFSTDTNMCVLANLSYTHTVYCR